MVHALSLRSNFSSDENKEKEEIVALEEVSLTDPQSGRNDAGDGGVERWNGTGEASSFALPLFSLSFLRVDNFNIDLHDPFKRQ